MVYENIISACRNLYHVIICALQGNYNERCIFPMAGFDPKYAAAIFTELMEREFPKQKFVVQGGDWGALITSLIAGHYPERLLGIHVNMFTPPRVDEDFRLIPWQVSDSFLTA